MSPRRNRRRPIDEGPLHTPPPEPPFVLAPDYADGEACAICFEGFGGAISIGWLDRFLHRRRWGHNPVSLRATVDPHTRMVAKAERYREERR